MKPDDIYEYIRKSLSKYIGVPTREETAQKLSGEILRTLNEVREKRAEKIPVGSYAYVSGFGPGFLEPDSTMTLYDDGRVDISMCMLLPGAKVLILDDEPGKRGKDVVRVMVLETGTVGWTSSMNLVRW